jgi:hypothetical protein
LAGSSCGPAFTVGTAGGTDGGSTLDVGAPVDSGGGGVGDADAGATYFCAAQDAAHTLCEDFSGPQPFPDQFVKLAANTGTVEPDTATYRSPPESALAVTMSQTAGIGAAIIAHDFSSAGLVGQHFTLQDWVQLDSTGTCFDNGGAVAIASLVFPSSKSHYEIDIVASSAGASIVESVSPDGGAAVLTPHDLAGAPGVNMFYPWIVDVNLALTSVSKTAAITIGGTMYPRQQLTAVPTGENFTGPTLLLGASVSGQSGGCKIHVDDILFDISTL